MSLREWLNKNSPAVVFVAIIVLIGCAFFVLKTSEVQHPPMIKNTWYFDLETNKLFIGPSDAFPPIPTLSGHKDLNGNNLGVRAVVFSCGKCEDESSRYIGYLETLTPEAREQMIAMQHPSGEPAPIIPHKPIPSTQPTTGPATTMAATTAPGIDDPLMNGRLISDAKNINWVVMASSEGGELTQKAMSNCGKGKYPTQCFPDLQ